MAEFLLEIGFEEMPAPWLSDLAKQFEAKFLSLAGDARLSPSGARVLWTSRRLVLVADVKRRQDDRTAVEWGPAAKIAKDPSGKWTKAAEGFAKKQGVGLEALKLAPKVEGSADMYVSVTKHVAGRATAEVLGESLAPLLRGFNFPKRMNWDAWLDDGRGAFEFGRPIQWIVALLDGEVVPFTIFEGVAGGKGAARVTSGRRSMGNRFYPREAVDRGFDAQSFKELEAGLRTRFVLLDRAARVREIQAKLDTLPNRLVVKSGLGALDELARGEWPDLVEWPAVVVGYVPPDLQDLPLDVMATVLRVHQKCLALGQPGHGPVTAFAAITGCDEGGQANAARGQERVVVARLKDARFFYNEDRRRRLSDRVKDLSAVSFHRGLGSYEEKVLRTSALARRRAASTWTLAHDQEAWQQAERALLLSKADLTTLMVREFPELQGTMGGIYAQLDHESAEVSAAIRWQYFPFSMEEGAEPAGLLSPSQERTFAVVSLLDKLDTLVNYFGAGLEPTGSSDPYGLRRAGQGVARLLLDFYGSPRPSVLDLIVELRLASPSAKSQSDDRTRADPVVESLGSFLRDRLRAVLALRGAGESDEIDAVLSARVNPLDDVQGTQERLRELARVRSEQREVFAALAEAFKRAKNIVGDRSTGAVDQAAFVESSEGLLHAAIVKAEMTPASDPAARLRAVAGLRGELDSFFKSVMVMADDPKLKANRLALLSRLLNLVYEVADLSKLASPAGDSATSS